MNETNEYLLKKEKDFYILRDAMIELTLAPFDDPDWFRQRARAVLIEIGYIVE